MTPRVGIVVSSFNRLVTEPLLQGARMHLEERGVPGDAIEVHWVPGAWELPLALQWMAQSGRFDGMVALGCVIRGSTPHFDYVAGHAAGAAARVQETHGLPVGFGVLTTDTLEQALERAGSKMGNKGAEAAEAVLSMCRLRGKLT
ncbi:MAG: 6,7-dimethyl-8-ribityllumazine synthase [Myxococcota bacterium]